MTLRRELTFRYSGKSPSPVLDHLLNRSLEARIELTSIGPEGVGCLVNVRGPSTEISSFAALLARTELAAPNEVRSLSRTTDDIAYFGFCPTPGDGTLQVAQLAERELGPNMTYEARIEGGACIVTVRSHDDAPLEEFYKKARAQLMAQYAVALDRLGPPAPKDAALPLNTQDELVLLVALQAGYFEPERVAGVREIGDMMGKTKSSVETALRRATGRLVDYDLAAQSPAIPTLVFEYWNGVPKSAHYANLLATPDLRARVESLNVQRDAAWQIVIAEGPPNEINELRQIIELPPTPPIRAMGVLHHAPGTLVYHDHWTRPDDAKEGISLEHILFDHCGRAGRLHIRFRHGVARVNAIGPHECTEAFFSDVMRLMGDRFDIERIPDGVPNAERDKQVLSVARAQGYFEVPRRHGLLKVGRALDVSASTAGTAIRRAIRRAILQHVQGARRAQDRRGAKSLD